MKLKNSIEDNIKTLLKLNGNSEDIVYRIINKKNNKICCVFLESVSNDNKISEFVNKAIINSNKKIIGFKSIYFHIKNNLYNSNLSQCTNFEDAFYYLSSGFTIVFIEGEQKAIVVETKENLDRGITEATSEPIVRGPKDSFTENHHKNIGLIRKRIKDYNLFFEDTKIGKRTKTKVTISYINDIVPKDKIIKIKKILNSINIDGIIDSGYIRELIEKKQTSLFPKIISTERPDLACTSLLNGKIVILVENTPFILILPAVLTDFLHSPEDYYQKPFNASFNRILRFLCFFLSISTPAIYIALMTYNPEMIPDQLLISLASQRAGVPFPTTMEVLIFVITFEFLREADIHAPNFSGSAMNIVGALILGDAAVAAGIVSPIVIIIVAITSISELIFYDIDVINALREWRIIFIISSSLLGIIGYVLGFIIFIAKLNSMECLGTPYLTPFSPFNKNLFKDGLIRVSRKNIKNRPTYLTNNIKRMDDIA